MRSAIEMRPVCAIIESGMTAYLRISGLTLILYFFHQSLRLRLNDKNVKVQWGSCWTTTIYFLAFLTVFFVFADLTDFVVFFAATFYLTSNKIENHIKGYT
jgi:hypothetical protein